MFRRYDPLLLLATFLGLWWLWQVADAGMGRNRERFSRLEHGEFGLYVRSGDGRIVYLRQRDFPLVLGSVRTLAR